MAINIEAITDLLAAAEAAKRCLFTVPGSEATHAWDALSRAIPMIRTELRMEGIKVEVKQQEQPLKEAA